MISKKKTQGARARVAKLIRGSGKEKVLLELKPTLRNYLLLRTY